MKRAQLLLRRLLLTCAMTVSLPFGNLTAQDNLSPEGSSEQIEAEEFDTEQFDTEVEDDSSGFQARLNDLGLTGSLRAAYWSSNRLLDDESDIGVASTWLKLDRWIGPVGIFAEGYFTNEDIFGAQYNASRLREAYVDVPTEAWDIRIGKQIIAWGRADRFNPTDNLTPRDFTLLVPEVDEDRFGSLAAQATWHPTDTLSMIAIWLPDFEPNVLPPAAPPGITAAQRIPTSRRQWALKLDQSGANIDWSVSYFDGFNLNPDLSPGATAGTILLDYHRTSVFGIDAATTRGSYRFALEAAYTQTIDPDGNDPFVRNPFFYGVAGIERSFSDDLSVIVQGYYRRVENYSHPEQVSDPALRALAVQQAILSAQYDLDQYGLSLRIGKQWLSQTLEGEVGALVRLDRSAYTLRPKLAYAVSDQVKLIIGAEYSFGSDKTIFRELERNNGVFAEARYFF
jgi:hypothetical protein